jgi:hypothetical protein
MSLTTSRYATHFPNLGFQGSRSAVAPIAEANVSPTSPFTDKNFVAVKIPDGTNRTVLIPFEEQQGAVRIAQKDGKVITVFMPATSPLSAPALADRVSRLIATGQLDITNMMNANALAHGTQRVIGLQGVGLSVATNNAGIDPIADKSIEKGGSVFVTTQEKTMLAAAGLQFSTGVGDYWAVGFDTNSVLVKGFEAAVGFLLKKMKIPAPAVAKLKDLIQKLEKIAGGPTGQVLRFELNGSFLAALHPDPKVREEAQSASGQLHIKFSPVAAATPDKIFAAIDFYGGALAIIEPRLSQAIFNLKKDITLKGDLKPGASTVSKIIYNEFINTMHWDSQASPAPTPRKKGFSQRPLNLFDSRISINWYRWATKNDPDVRLGRMYVPLGFPEKFNAYLEGLGKPSATGQPSKLKKFFSKFSVATAPYISYRLGFKNGLPNYFNIVTGAGGLLLASPQTTENTRARKPFFFPGFYVSFKLSLEDAKKFVATNGGWAFPMSVNGRTRLVEVPKDIVEKFQSFFGLSLSPSKEKSTESGKSKEAITFDQFVLENILSGVSPELLKAAESALKYAELPLEVLSNPKLQDALEDISTITSITGITAKTYPPAAPLTALFSSIIVFGGRNSRNELETFYQERFLPTLIDAKEAGVLKQMASLFKSIQRLGEIDIKNFKGIGYSPAVYGEKEEAIKAAFSLFDRSIKKAISEGKLDPVAFYAALKVSLNSGDITESTLAALFLENRSLPGGTSQIRLVVNSGTAGVQSAVVPINDFELSNYFEKFKGTEQARRLSPDVKSYLGEIAKVETKFLGAGLTQLSTTATQAEIRIANAIVEPSSDGTKNTANTRSVLELFTNTTRPNEAATIEAMGGILRRLASSANSAFSLSTITDELLKLAKSDGSPKIVGAAKELLKSGLFRTVGILQNLNEASAKKLRYVDLFVRPETPSIAANLVDLYLSNGGTSFGVAAAFLKAKPVGTFFKSTDYLPASAQALIKTYSTIFASFSSNGTLDNKSSMKRFVQAALENPSSLDRLIGEYRQLYLESISGGRNRATGFRDSAGVTISPSELARLDAKATAFVNTRLLNAAKYLIKLDLRTNLLSRELQEAIENGFRLGLKFETRRPPGYDAYFNNGSKSAAIELAQ